MLEIQQPYRDLGADYFDRRDAEQLKRSLGRRLEDGQGATTGSPSKIPPRGSQPALFTLSCGSKVIMSPLSKVEMSS